MDFKGYRCIYRGLSEQELLIKINDLLQDDAKFWILYVPKGKEKPIATPSSLIKDPENFLKQIFDSVQWESDMSGTLKPLTAIYVKI